MSKNLADDILRKINQIKRQKSLDKNSNVSNPKMSDQTLGFNISKEGLASFKKNKDVPTDYKQYNNSILNQPTPSNSNRSKNFF